MTPADRSLPKAPARSALIGAAATLPFSLPGRVAAYPEEPSTYIGRNRAAFTTPAQPRTRK